MSSSATRLLDIYHKLLNGAAITKEEFAQKYEVAPRTIQRDLADIRLFLEEYRPDAKLQYNRSTKSSYLAGQNNTLGKAETLALCKILLASRAFTKKETDHLLGALNDNLPPAEQKELNWIIKNEQSNYVELQHTKALLQILWEFSNYIVKHRLLNIVYTRQDKKQVTHTILPKAIIFSDYYFYVVSYSQNAEQYLFFRLDRIIDYTPLDKKAGHSQNLRYEDGKLRQNIQFMTPGDLLTITFEFSGTVEAALDRFPNSKVIKKLADSVVIESETIDQGAMMWLLSQGKRVKVLSPDNFKAKMKQELKEMLQNYTS